jgi:hypothetical protein
MQVRDSIKVDLNFYRTENVDLNSSTVDLLARLFTVWLALQLCAYMMHMKLDCT